MLAVTVHGRGRFGTSLGTLRCAKMYTIVLVDLQSMELDLSDLMAICEVSCIQPPSRRANSSARTTRGTARAL